MVEETSVAAKRRLPRKATRKSLENAALHYLERFASSRSNLRQVLARRVLRSARAHGTDPAEAETWIAEIIEKFERLGLLDDKAYAEMRVTSLRRRGLSARMVRMKLIGKGVETDIVDTALDAGVPDTVAAIALARKRRLGPFRNSDRAAHRERDLAALARAGFTYDTVLRIVDAESDQSLLDESDPDSAF